jgi:hypothetical protein
MFDEGLFSYVRVWDQAAVDEDITLSESEKEALSQEINRRGFALRAEVGVRERVVLPEPQGSIH